MRGVPSVQGSKCQGDDELFFFRDLDLAEFRGLDGGRIQVIADGLNLFQSAQLAVDTTMVSPLRRDGTARRGGARRPGVALEQARRTKEATCPELEGDEGRARLVVLAAEAGDVGQERLHNSFGAWRQGQSGDSTPSDEGCMVEEVELHPGVQRRKGLRTVPSREASEPSTGVSVPSEQEVLRDDRFG